MLLMSLWIFQKANAFQGLPNICEANLVFVGTVTNQSSYYRIAPGTNPHHPNGRISTHFTLSISRLVVDETGDGADGSVTVSLPGGQIDSRITRVPEMPSISVGDQYGFAVRWIPGRTDPLILGWTYVPPNTELPKVSELQAEWAGYCDAQ